MFPLICVGSAPVLHYPGQRYTKITPFKVYLQRKKEKKKTGQKSEVMSHVVVKSSSAKDYSLKSVLCTQFYTFIACI